MIDVRAWRPYEHKTTCDLSVWLVCARGQDAQVLRPTLSAIGLAPAALARCGLICVLLSACRSIGLAIDGLGVSC